MKKLAMIAKEEKIKIDEPALELIAAAAEGSFRDAESLLDQIASLGIAIDLPTAERVTGRTGLKKIHEFAALVLRQRPEGRPQLCFALDRRRIQSRPIRERPYPLSPQSAFAQGEPFA